MEDQKQNPKQLKQGVPPPSAPAVSELETPEDRAMREARIANEALVGATLIAITGPKVGINGALRYLADYLGPDVAEMDPVERIMREQFVVAHHQVLHLHHKITLCKSDDGVRIVSAAASRLLGEMRRLAVVIRNFRTGPAHRSFQVIGQQNNVAKGDQQVSFTDAGHGKQSSAVIDRPAVEPQVESASSRISGYGNVHEESEPGGSRSTQRTEAAALVG
jgi:hypothetical protein